MAKKKKPQKKTSKKKPTKKRSNPKKGKPAKQKKKGVMGSAVEKIPESVRIKGGKAKSKSKNTYGTIETEAEYKDLKVGK